MALICPDCSTENRDGANFCRSCGEPLVATTTRMPPAPSPDREWATTAPAQLRAPTIPAPLFDPAEPVSSRSFFGRAPVAPPEDERTVIAAPGEPSRAPSPPSASSSMSEAARAERAERKKTRVKVRRTVPVERPPRKRVILLWLGLLVVALLMIVAGWYGYGTRKAPVGVEETAPPVSEPAAAAVVAPPPVEASPAPAADEPPAPALVPAPEAEAPQAPVATPSKPIVKPRKQATVAAPPPSASEPSAPPVVAAPPPPPAPAAEPMAMCGDRNFIAKAQCMAAQCLKPEYKAHAQCEAVRRQQRIEEEKRNPSLIN
ncbi:zinc-ribbon domain-containing protein [Variovorax sp. GB1P17]|uniref:zinc-ribbon domain-containing protein n=1 Tax=Variovorax sp. GB1P17 TaxID=3443740 RepID=UPI003F48A511